MNVPRIGPPPPEMEPLVLERLSDSTLRRMTSAELVEHGRRYLRVERLMNEYLNNLQDHLRIREDIEAACSEGA